MRYANVQKRYNILHSTNTAIRKSTILSFYSKKSSTDSKNIVKYKIQGDSFITNCDYLRDTYLFLGLFSLINYPS